MAQTPEERRAYQRAWQAANRDKVREYKARYIAKPEARAKKNAQARRYVKGRQPAIYKAVCEYKEAQGCADCKQKLPHYVLDFDHLPGKGKRANVSAMVHWNSHEAVWAEVAKCEVVCANCHRIRTWKRKMNVA